VTASSSRRQAARFGGAFQKSMDDTEQFRLVEQKSIVRNWSLLTHLLTCRSAVTATTGFFRAGDFVI